MNIHASTAVPGALLVLLATLPFVTIPVPGAGADGPSPVSGPATGDIGPQEIRNMFHGSLEPEEAGRVIAAAFDSRTEERVRRWRALSAPGELARRATELVEAGDPGPDRDRLLLVAAESLSSRGGPESREVLEGLVRLPPVAVIRLPGCRRVLSLPVFPYPGMAMQALHRIDREEAIETFRRLPLADRIDWFLAGPEEVPARAWLSAATTALDDLDGEELDRLIDRSGSVVESLSLPATRLLVRAHLHARRLPELQVFRKLPEGAARHFLEEARGQVAWEPDEILELARSHPGLLSLTAFLEGERVPLDPRAFLLRHRASGAAVLARNSSVERTEALEGLANSKNSSPSLRRDAVLALMLQGTPSARRSLSRLALGGDPEDRLRRKIRSWLRREEG